MEKVTKVFKEKTIAEKFAEIRDLPSLTDEMREFLDKEIDKVCRKNSHKGKANKAKEEMHDRLESAIMEVLQGSTEPLSASLLSIAVGSSVGEYVSTQKITPRCKSLITDGFIECVVEKRVNKYRIVAE